MLARARAALTRRQARTRLARCVARYRRLHPQAKPPLVVKPPVVVPQVTPPVTLPVDPPPPPPPPPPGGPAGATVFYDDAFAGSAPAAFWNASTSGVTVADGQATIPAGGAWLGTDRYAAHVLPGFSRDMVLHVVSGDGPGVTLYNRDTGAEVLDVSAHEHVFDVWVDDTTHVGSWLYPQDDTWWRIHTDGTHIAIDTSFDGTTWTPAGTQDHVALAGGVTIVRVTSAGNSLGHGSIGHGTSTTPTMIDHFTWWDDVLDDPVATDLTSPVLDDGQRPDENPIANGWLTPGFADHSAMQLLGHRILGAPNSWNGDPKDNGLVIWPTAFGPASEAWGEVAAPAAPATEYTLFAALQPDLNHRAGYDCWTNGDKLYAGRFDAPSSFYYLIPGIPLPGGALAAGDHLGLVVRDSTVTVAVKRAAGTWQAIAHAYDPTYTGGQTGYALIDHNGVSGAWSALGGGTIAP